MKSHSCNLIPCNKIKAEYSIKKQKVQNLSKNAAKNRSFKSKCRHWERYCKRENLLTIFRFKKFNFLIKIFL